MSDAGPLFQSILCSFLLISLAAPQLNAARHPVPLDEKTNAATCSQCHADKTKGEVVHPAMAGGCLVCHEVRVSGKITWVKLTTGTSLSLCLTCHPDKNAEQIKGKVHPPAIHGCVVCHDPHTSNYKYLLVNLPPELQKLKIFASVATTPELPFQKTAVAILPSMWDARRVTVSTNPATRCSESSRIT